jgi:hypothetical protein
MKVQGGSGTSATSAPSRVQGQAAPGFAPINQEEDVREAAPAGRTALLGGVNSLDALLALQEAPGPMERRKRAVKRAGKLLDLLDSVKISLLEGGAGNAALSQLTQAVRESRAGTDDPMLEGVLDEIETRAAVELAKQEVALETGSRAA